LIGNREIKDLVLRLDEDLNQFEMLEEAASEKYDLIGKKVADCVKRTNYHIQKIAHKLRKIHSGLDTSQIPQIPQIPQIS